MGEVKQINIKNRTYYFYNDMINIKNFESNMLKIDKKHYKGINIYYIRCITIKRIDDYENIYSVNPWDENKEPLRKYADLWNGIKNKIEAINDIGKNNYEKVCVKIKFNSDNDFPLNKPVKFYAMTIIIRSVFEEDGNLYPQVFLDDALYEL